MDYIPIESKPIDGKIYCNLKSPHHFQFVDRNGIPTGELLRAAPTGYGKHLTVKLMYRKLDELEVATTGLLNAGMEENIPCFELMETLSEDLKSHIRHCQNKKRIDYIVVDRDVMAATRSDPTMTIKKFFMPVMQDHRRHRFYKVGEAYVFRSAVNTAHVMTHESQYHLQPVAF